MDLSFFFLFYSLNYQMKDRKGLYTRFSQVYFYVILASSLNFVL